MGRVSSAVAGSRLLLERVTCNGKLDRFDLRDPSQKAHCALLLGECGP